MKKLIASFMALAMVASGQLAVSQENNQSMDYLERLAGWHDLRVIDETSFRREAEDSPVIAGRQSFSLFRLGEQYSYYEQMPDGQPNPKINLIALVEGGFQVNYTGTTRNGIVPTERVLNSAQNGELRRAGINPLPMAPRTVTRSTTSSSNSASSSDGDVMEAIIYGGLAALLIGGTIMALSDSGDSGQQQGSFGCGSKAAHVNGYC